MHLPLSLWSFKERDFEREILLMTRAQGMGIVPCGVVGHWAGASSPPHVLCRSGSAFAPLPSVATDHGRDGSGHRNSVSMMTHRVTTMPRGRGTRALGADVVAFAHL